MKDLEFHPDVVQVKVGDAVTWRNDDTVDHNVTARNGARFASRAFGSGGTYRFTPKQAGTVTYVCTLHPGMNGRIEVKP
ncbi:MAG TPA: plastocyanin/azurin family copper-binding protein [Thermoleophilaceae bacterium]|jgi:plastocyanin